MTETAVVPITYPEVINAARALEAEGVKVTILAIRERIGRGSFSTVKKFLERWNEERDSNGLSSRAIPIPTSLESLWTEACKQAEASVAQERQAVQQMAAELDDRFEQLQASARDSDSRRLQAEQRFADLQKSLEHAYADIAELKSQRTELEQRLYGMLELAAQERHAFLETADKIAELRDQMLTMSASEAQRQATVTALVQMVEQLPSELRQVEHRLLESAAADRQRLVDRDEYWQRALSPLGTFSSTLETVLRIVRQRQHMRPLNQGSCAHKRSPSRLRSGVRDKRFS